MSTSNMDDLSFVESLFRIVNKIAQYHLIPDLLFIAMIISSSS